MVTMKVMSLLIIVFVLWPKSVPAQQKPGCVDGSSQEMRGDAYIGTIESGWAARSLAASPGEKRTLRIFVQRGPGVHEPDACAEWSVDPSSAARVDRSTGTITVAPDAKHNTSFLVHARIPGMREISATLRVFDRKQNPLVGRWRQDGFPVCKGEKPITVAEPIRELDINADGTFTVTWHPFETYVDYWGTYEHNVTSGAVRMKVDGGNFVPADFNGEGRFSADAQGGLTLSQVWLGSRSARGKPRSCAYQFKQ
jgi:hypothetical protein